jgi:hypothetical protein
MRYIRHSRPRTISLDFGFRRGTGGKTITKADGRIQKSKVLRRKAKLGAEEC